MSDSADPERYSDAAQLERTVLAWNRSSLAIGANGALLAREGFERSLSVVIGLGFGVVALAVVLWIASIGQYSPALERRATHLIADDDRAVVALAALAVALSLVDVVLVLG
jgi:uncharacterized membrane protein YidH (DUF202 family)